MKTIVHTERTIVFKIKPPGSMLAVRLFLFKRIGTVCSHEPGRVLVLHCVPVWLVVFINYKFLVHLVPPVPVASLVWC